MEMQNDRSTIAESNYSIIMINIICQKMLEVVVSGQGGVACGRGTEPIYLLDDNCDKYPNTDPT